MEGDGYIRQLNEISSALKRKNEQAKVLRDKQKEVKRILYEWMDRNGHSEYGGYKLEKIKPRPKIKRKPVKKRDEDTIILFREIGVPDPKELLTKIKNIQKGDE